MTDTTDKETVNTDTKVENTETTENNSQQKVDENTTNKTENKNNNENPQPTKSEQIEEKKEDIDNNNTNTNNNNTNNTNKIEIISPIPHFPVNGVPSEFKKWSDIRLERNELKHIRDFEKQMSEHQKLVRIPPHILCKYFLGSKLRPQKAEQKFLDIIEIYHKYNMIKIPNKEMHSCFKKLSESFHFGGVTTQKYPILCLNVSKFLPGDFKNAASLIKSFLVIMDILTQDLDTSRNGMVFIAYCRGLGFKNFSYDLEKLFIKIIQELYPLRLKGIYIVDAPFLVHGLLKMVRPFLSKKMKERTFIITYKELIKNVVSKDQLPKIVFGDNGSYVLNETLYETASRFVDYFSSRNKLLYFDSVIKNQDKISKVSSELAESVEIHRRNSKSHEDKMRNVGDKLNNVIVYDKPLDDTAKKLHTKLDEISSIDLPKQELDPETKRLHSKLDEISSGTPQSKMQEVGDKLANTLEYNDHIEKRKEEKIKKTVDVMIQNIDKKEQQDTEQQNKIRSVVDSINEIPVEEKPLDENTKKLHEKLDEISRIETTPSPQPPPPIEEEDNDDEPQQQEQQEDNDNDNKSTEEQPNDQNNNENTENTENTENNETNDENNKSEQVEETNEEPEQPNEEPQDE